MQSLPAKNKVRLHCGCTKISATVKNLIGTGYDGGHGLNC